MDCLFNEIAKKQIEDIKNAISTNKAWHWYNAEANYLRTITERSDGKFLVTKGNYSAVWDKNLNN